MPDNEIQIPDALADLIDAAFEHALDSIEDGGTLIPFTLLHDAAGETALTRHFVEHAVEEGVVQARLALREAAPGTARVTLAFDGFLHDADGGKVDAIFVEAQEAGLPAYRLALPYEPATEEAELTLLEEEPLLLDGCEPLLAPFAGHKPGGLSGA